MRVKLAPSFFLRFTLWPLVRLMGPLLLGCTGICPGAGADLKGGAGGWGSTVVGAGVGAGAGAGWKGGAEGWAGTGVGVGVDL